MSVTDGSTLSGEDRERYVRNLFDRIARPYDRLNRVISLGRDVLWRKIVLDRARVRRGMTAVDLGTGTGDFFLLLLDRVGADGRVVGIDLSPEMLEIAKSKSDGVGAAMNRELRVGKADATGMPDDSVDVVTMGWVLRNVGDRAAVYREVQRILRPGGVFVCLDMSRPSFAPFRWASALYLSAVMPIVVRFFGGDREAYEYLARSTARFPAKDELALEWAGAGFVDIETQSFMTGTIAAHFGRKSARAGGVR